MSKDNGGFAFPGKHRQECAYNGHNDGFEIVNYQGMTLRDYFAAKAINGILGVHTGLSNRQLAEQAYEMADAMLTERAK